MIYKKYLICVSLLTNIGDVFVQKFDGLDSKSFDESILFEDYQNVQSATPISNYINYEKYYVKIKKKKKMGNYSIWMWSFNSIEKSW